MLPTVRQVPERVGNQAKVVVGHRVCI